MKAPARRRRLRRLAPMQPRRRLRPHPPPVRRCWKAPARRRLRSQRHPGHHRHIRIMKPGFAPALAVFSLIGVAAGAVIAGLEGVTATHADAAPQAAAKATQFTLKNGMQLVVIPDHRAPVVTHMVWFHVGGTDDPPGLSGAAHFFEHLMFRGTKAVPNGELSKIVARNGGQDNAQTSQDYTVYFHRIAKDPLPIVIELEADPMVNLDLSV